MLYLCMYAFLCRCTNLGRAKVCMYWGMDYRVYRRGSTHMERGGSYLGTGGGKHGELVEI